MAKKLFLVMAALTALIIAANPVMLGAGEGNAELKSPVYFDEPLMPANVNYLSSSPWLILTGQDPSMGIDVRIEHDKEIRQSPPEQLQGAGGAATALIPYRSPAAKFSRNILISRDYGRIPYQTEPHISVDPKDPDHIIAGMIDYNFPGVVTYVSIDGGATWEGPSQPKIPRGEFTGSGDPVTAFDRSGNAYIAQLSIKIEDFLVAGVWGSTYSLGIVVTKSSDGGFNWGETVNAAPGEIYTFDYNVPEGEKPRGELWAYSTDKPWMTIGPSPTDPSRDIIYVTYTLFLEKYSVAWLDELPALMIVDELAWIGMVYSEDGGKTWSAPRQVSPVVNTNPSDGQKGRLVHGSQPTVAPDGTLYVAYFDSTTDGAFEGNGQIMVASSKNKGQSFSQGVVAARFLELDYLPRSSSFRLFGTGFPQTAMGPNGEIYIAYTAYPADRPTDSGDIFMVSSFDGGKTWAPPKRINDDNTDRLQFFPSIAVDPGGELHAMWGDTRDDTSELVYHIYYSNSTNKGVTWEFNSRVSDFPSNPNFAFSYGAFIGDYFSIKAVSDDVYMVWADSRLGEVTGTNQKIAFARQTLMPTPSIFLSPPSGPAGRDITIQGSYFQPETEIFIEMGGVLIATGYTDLNGNFNHTIFAPISGEGARDIVAIEMSGNVASASFYTEFGFDTFQDSIDQIQSRLDEIETAGTGGNGDGEPAAEEGFDWLATILGSALAIALVALVAMWYRMRRISSS